MKEEYYKKEVFESVVVVVEEVLYARQRQQQQPPPPGLPSGYLIVLELLHPSIFAISLLFYLISLQLIHCFKMMFASIFSLSLSLSLSKFCFCNSEQK